MDVFTKVSNFGNSILDFIFRFFYKFGKWENVCSDASGYVNFMPPPVPIDKTEINAHKKDAFYAYKIDGIDFTDEEKSEINRYLWLHRQYISKNNFHIFCAPIYKKIMIWSMVTIIFVTVFCHYYFLLPKIFIFIINFFIALVSFWIYKRIQRDVYSKFGTINVDRTLYYYGSEPINIQAISQYYQDSFGISFAVLVIPLVTFSFWVSSLLPK